MYVTRKSNIKLKMQHYTYTASYQYRMALAPASTQTAPQTAVEQEETGMVTITRTCLV